MTCFISSKYFILLLISYSSESIDIIQTHFKTFPASFGLPIKCDGEIDNRRAAVTCLDTDGCVGFVRKTSTTRQICATKCMPMYTTEGMLYLIHDVSIIPPPDLNLPMDMIVDGIVIGDINGTTYGNPLVAPMPYHEGNFISLNGEGQYIDFGQQAGSCREILH